MSQEKELMILFLYTWEEKITKAQRIKARKTGDTSHVNKGLFKKVYTINEEGERVPLVQESNTKVKMELKEPTSIMYTK